MSCTRTLNHVNLNVIWSQTEGSIPSDIDKICFFNGCGSYLFHLVFSVHFQGIIEEAKRKNVDSLQKLNANISRIGIPLVTTMFDHVKDYIDNPSVNLTNVVMQFFRDSFPPLFNYATGQSQKFSTKYEKCLKDNVNTVQIFGNSPFRIAADLEKVLRPMQVFLQSMSFASKTVDDTKALGFTKGCPPLLLQMKYCSLCNGLDNNVKPCENYCIDVLKSCLTTSIQLQSQWSSYFDALSNLATSLSKSSKLKTVLYTVFHELSLAIYQAVPAHMSDANLKVSKKHSLVSFQINWE